MCQEPKDVCDKLPEPGKYEPRIFTTTALQQAQVKLTWDETTLDRQQIAKKINAGQFDELSKADVRSYLASASSDDESGSYLKQMVK